MVNLSILKTVVQVCLTSSVFLSTSLLLPTLTSQPASAQTSEESAAADPYEQAKAELPEDWYVVYRIIDRIARANGLDNQNWRIAVVPEYNINAFATDVNLIAIYDGILDQLAGDTSAIACVIAHEMAHHIERHIAVGAAEKAALIEKIEQEAEQEVNAEVKDARADSTATSVGGAVFRNVLGGRAGSIGGAVLDNESRQRLNRSEQRVQEIVEEKQQKLEEEIAANTRKQEFEADEYGYKYSAQAGFEPEGCLRVMEVLNRTPGAEFDTSHPAIPKRIEQIRQLMSENPPESLAEKGKAMLSGSQPLTYDLSKDGASLRVNSRRGGSSANDIERLFDQ